MRSEGWNYTEGLIPNVLLDIAPNPGNCITCGPPIMIKFIPQALEKRMKGGVWESVGVVILAQVT